MDEAGSITVVRCADCGALDPTPRGVCRACLSDRLEPVGVAGTGALDVFIVPLFSAIIFLAANLALFARPTVLRSRPLIYLGEISYATYMVHFYILLMLEKIATRFLGAPEGVLPTAFLYLGLALIWIASALLYHFVETPMRRIVRDRGMLLLDRRAARNP